MALAYFITFHTYGTWLHGTSKGMGSVDLEHNSYGEEYIAPDAQRENESREAMAQPAYILRSAEEREVVCNAIINLCQERSWNLLAVHVRTNHVHTVVQGDRDPGRMMSDMKARASRALTRAGCDDANRRRWTRHGSTLHLFDEEAVADKIDYTLNRQGAKMAWYDGRRERARNEPRTKRYSAE